MKTRKIGLLFLTATVVSLLLAACFSDWMGEEVYGTVIIRLASNSTSRQLMGLTGTDVPVVNGQAFEIRAYATPSSLSSSSNIIGNNGQIITTPSSWPTGW